MESSSEPRGVQRMRALVRCTQSCSLFLHRQIGLNLQGVPADVQVVDGTGRYVIPGCVQDFVLGPSQESLLQAFDAGRDGWTRRSVVTMLST